MNRKLVMLFTFLGCFLFDKSWSQQHPITFATKSDFSFVKQQVNQFALLKSSYSQLKNEVDLFVGKEVDVPFPKDAAGGYTHDRHKSNYMLMYNSGLLYNLTGDAKYALFVRDMLLKYAVLNPQLKNHPQATSSSPGRLFWQALNDANWLVYTGMAYDLVYNSLSAADRKKIEDGAFKPEVDYLTKDLKAWFNLIHNHGVWACAGVGIVGLATNNKDYVDQALYGTAKDGKSGFIAQMNQLFSPDGYYTEGPYYVRYAILPYYIFANALQNAKPQLRIFEHRGQILRKALTAALQQTNINGRFFPINDALKEKDYTSNEIVTAVNIAWSVYGKDSGLLAVAHQQNKVLLNRGGASLAAAMASAKNRSAFYPYQTVEYRDGAKGTEGGISFLRMGKNADLTTIAFKYAAHGLSHGHYDRLGFFLFNKGNEVFQDYGSARFVNVEQKYGGRYLPENKAYAAQTIAHSTLVADEKSHFNGKEEEAEKHHAQKLYSDVGRPHLQVVSAKEDHAYKNIQLHRTLYFLQLPESRLVVDVFRATSPDRHQYDLPFQYNGQLINTSFKYTAHTTSQKTLGVKNGYQFLWKEAEAKVKDTVAQFTFLNNDTYYTVSSLIKDSAELFFTRAGANDPQFNLRREPSYIIRKNSDNETFVNVIEIHGKFDPVTEMSTNSYPSVKNIRIRYQDENYTITEFSVGARLMLIAQSNKAFGADAKHQVKADSWHMEWTGPYTVLVDNKPLL